jgi:hypothetical protein
MDMHNSFFVLFVIVVKKFSRRISQELFFVEVNLTLQ